MSPPRASHLPRRRRTWTRRSCSASGCSTTRGARTRPSIQGTALAPPRLQPTYAPRDYSCSTTRDSRRSRRHSHPPLRRPGVDPPDDRHVLGRRPAAPPPRMDRARPVAVLHPCGARGRAFGRRRSPARGGSARVGHARAGNGRRSRGRSRSTCGSKSSCVRGSQRGATSTRSPRQGCRHTFGTKLAQTRDSSPGTLNAWTSDRRRAKTAPAATSRGRPALSTAADGLDRPPGGACRDRPDDRGARRGGQGGRGVRRRRRALRPSLRGRDAPVPRQSPRDGGNPDSEGRWYAMRSASTGAPSRR